MSNYLEEYSKRIRRFMQDFAEKNQLIVDGAGNPAQEAEEEDIMEAIESVFNHCVECPPVKLPYSISKMANFLWFKWGVIAHLLDTQVLINTRNYLPVSDGGISIDENYKAGPYANIANSMWTKFEAGLEGEKIRYNIENFPWGGTSDVYPAYYYYPRY